MFFLLSFICTIMIVLKIIFVVPCFFGYFAFALHERHFFKKLRYCLVAYVFTEMMVLKTIIFLHVFLIVSFEEWYSKRKVRLFLFFLSKMILCLLLV